MLLAPRNRPWLLLAAVAVLVGFYSVYWFAQLRLFKAEMASLQSGHSAVFDLKSNAVSYSGFPYRLEAEFTAAFVTRRQPDYEAHLTSTTLTVLRQPWKPHLFLLFADNPRVDVLVYGKAPLHVVARAAALEASLHLKQSQLGRLSLVFKSLQIPGGNWFADALTADTFEMHGRQLVQAQALATAATAPAFGEVVLSAEGLKLGDSRPARLAADLSLTGAPGKGEGTSYLQAWRSAGGTLEISHAAMDSQTLKLTGSGTASLDKTGAPLVSGSIETTLPAALRSALSGQAMEAEVPLRQPQRLTVRIQDGQMFLNDGMIRMIPLALGQN